MTKMKKEYKFKIREATKSSEFNRKAIETSKKCGCYRCISIFKPILIKDWNDSDLTAQCPFCYCDSVICDEQGYKITKKMLRELQEQGFGIKLEIKNGKRVINNK